MYTKTFKSVFHVFLILLTGFLISSCGANLNAYKNTEPEFDLFKFFEGKTQAWGMVRDIKGKQIRRFEVDIKGIVEGNTLVLHEYFLYADGKEEERVWKIMRKDKNVYTGSAADVIGEAYGESVGNALRWQYTLRIKTEKGEVDVQLDDWMFMQDENHMFNLATMKKFGITVGEITLFFKKNVGSFEG